MYKKFALLLAKTNETIYHVSKITGIPQSTLSEWKNGKIKMLGADKLKLLSEYFNVSIDYFLYDETAE